MSTAIRITPMNDTYSWDSNINFDEQEVLESSITLPRTNIIQDSQKQAPRIYDVSKAHGSTSIADRKIISINILHKWVTTQDKLDTLFGYNVIFKVYYKYITDVSTYIACILDPNHRKSYFFGEEGYIQTTLTFYETYEAAI